VNKIKGNFTGKNNPNFKHGNTLQQHYCKCGKKILKEESMGFYQCNCEWFKHTFCNQKNTTTMYKCPLARYVRDAGDIYNDQQNQKELRNNQEPNGEIRWQ
jgi:hypothetical protein